MGHEFELEDVGNLPLFYQDKIRPLIFAAYCPYWLDEDVDAGQSIAQFRIQRCLKSALINQISIKVNFLDTTPNFPIDFLSE